MKNSICDQVNLPRGKRRYKRTSCPSEKKKVGSTDRFCSTFCLIEEYHSCFLLLFFKFKWKTFASLRYSARARTILPSRFLAFSLNLALHYAAQFFLECHYSGARLVCSEGCSMLEWEWRLKSDSGRLVFLFPGLSHHSVTFSHATTVILASSLVSSCRRCWWRELLVLQELFVVKQKVPGETTVAWGEIASLIREQLLSNRY